MDFGTLGVSVVSCTFGTFAMSLIFLSIIGSKKGLINFLETLWLAPSDRTQDERASFKCSMGFRISGYDSEDLKHVYDKEIQTFPFKFRCWHFECIVNLKFSDVY